MLHRAILGSMERFIGILLEEHAGALPAWLAPVQAVLLSLTDRHAPYTASTEKYLASRGLRVAADLRNEKLGFKIREHTLQRVPYLLIVGDRELENQTVAVRTRTGKDLGEMTPQDFGERLAVEIASHGRTVVVEG
jgi:threonyl-tRNA synthetase